MRTAGDIAYQRPEQLGGFEILFQRLLKIHNRRVEVVFEDEVVIVKHLAEFGGKALAFEKIAYAHGTTRHLVFIGRADTASRGANGSRAFRLFARLVECDMRGQDQRAGGTYGEPLARGNALGLQQFEFLEQCRWIEYDTVADQAVHVPAQHAGWHKVQHRPLAAHDYGVPGVV